MFKILKVVEKSVVEVKCDWCKKKEIQKCDYNVTNDCDVCGSELEAPAGWLECVILDRMRYTGGPFRFKDSSLFVLCPVCKEHLLVVYRADPRARTAKYFSPSAMESALVSVLPKRLSSQCTGEKFVRREMSFDDDFIGVLENEVKEV